VNSVLLDANLLCLLVVGLTDRAAVAGHRRLSAFDVSDFDAVVEITDLFDDIILCPQVVAETSNLLRYDRDHRRYSEVLRRLVHSYEERSNPSRKAVETPEFLQLGVTDAVLALLASGVGAVLSADAKLCHAIARRGHRAINYNYVRDGALKVAQIASWVRA